jgi:hypothetical protein
MSNITKYFIRMYQKQEMQRNTNGSIIIIDIAERPLHKHGQWAKKLPDSYTKSTSSKSGFLLCEN